MNYGDERLAEPKPMDMAKAMKQAREDVELRREFFIETLTLQQRAANPTPKASPKLPEAQSSRAQKRKVAKAANAAKRGQPLAIEDQREKAQKWQGKRRKRRESGIKFGRERPSVALTL